MTIHELWQGGPAVSKLSRSQFPSYVFSASDAKIKALDMSQHYGTPYAVLRRVLDFKNDIALRQYFRDNAVAAADVLNVLLVPKGTLVLGYYVEVENPADGGALTLSFGTAGGTIIGDTSSAAVPIDATAAAAKFSAPNAAWITANGAMSLATATAQITPDMVQVTLTTKATAGLAGFGNLRLNVSAMVVQVNERTATNF
jgi:hypothetical protein